MIDSASDGFNLSEEAMSTLTCVGSQLPPFSVSFADLYRSDGQAEDLGVVHATGVQVNKSPCGSA